MELTRFKAFEKFTLHLKHFNLLVGPNNAGKSTVLAAFRMLSAALRRATSRRAKQVQGPNGVVLGHEVDLSAISVSEENIFFNYRDEGGASVVFTLNNKNTLTLYFPYQGVCYLLPDAQGRDCWSPKTFKREFDCAIKFVPILGPVEHGERLYEKEAAQRALFTYGAARNFRNIWYHFRENFDDFQAMIRQTWPGMDINEPEVDFSDTERHIHMFCPEKRILREIAWSGFGFQVWCQMLTHIVQSKDCSIFLIDEPDIYLHSELQRQLLTILRDLGPDILIATHSTEMITEAETNDIVMINKINRNARRVRDPSQLAHVFSALGSNLNPILTQLAKTKRVVFVEGKDFQIISRFARKLNKERIGNRQDFAVVPLDGFNPERMRSLKDGMEETLGTKIRAAAILDRDYRCDEECNYYMEKCGNFCDLVVVHKRKEIENYLLHPPSIDGAISREIIRSAARGGKKAKNAFGSLDVLEAFYKIKKPDVSAQLISKKVEFERSRVSSKDISTISREVIEEFEGTWSSFDGRTKCVPGKEALSQLNAELQREMGVSVTHTSIINAMSVADIPEDISKLIRDLDSFTRMQIGEG
ncbi:MAG: AAA family ATPase [Nisaea sp.]|nr:AAA family ATPase [Nisaea sp.]